MAKPKGKPLPRTGVSPGVFQALETRRIEQLPQTVLGLAFDKQQDFINHPARFKAACCTRRAGKTFSIGLYIFLTALQNPGCNILYLALTRAEAKKIIMKDVINDIEKRVGGTGVVINLSELTVTFPNGSTVYIDGADHSEQRHNLFTGGKYKLIIIDEAQFWKTSLFNLINKALKPSLIDTKGTLCLIGVPDAAKNFFYDMVTKRTDPVSGKVMYPAWTTFKWSALDNPHMSVQWQEELDELLATDPHFMETPTFFQQYLGQWVDDPEARCYRYHDVENRVAVLPGKVDDYVWVLGMDVGYNPDPMAFVVCGYRKDHTDNVLYFVEAFKKTKMSVEETGEKIAEFRSRYPISVYVMDGANGNMVGEMQNRLGLPFEKADKAGKNDHIHLMSDDLQRKKVMVVGRQADDLAEEWLKLVWDRTKPEKPREHPSCDNHCTDAALYAYFRSYHYVKAAPKTEAPRPNTDQWAADYQRRLAKRLSTPADPLKALDNL